MSVGTSQPTRPTRPTRPIEGRRDYRGAAVWHPFLALEGGAPLPSLAELVARSDAEARGVWLAAGRLAAERVELQDQLRATIDELEAPPWTGPAVGWRPEQPSVGVSDLLRALLGRTPAVVKVQLLDGSVGPDFDAAAGRWRQRCVDEAEDPCVRDGVDLELRVELSVDLGRRWALALAGVDPATAITPIEIAAQLRPDELDGLVAVEQRYCEGLVTRGESAASIWSSLERAGPHRLPRYDPTPAYFDRHGGLAALDAALVDGPGALIIGTSGTGRRSLLRAWRRRLVAGHGPEALAGWRVVEDPAFEPDARRQIDVHTPRMLDGGVEAGSPFHRELLDVLARAGASGSERRVVLIVDDLGFAPLRRQLPELDVLTHVRVPAFADHELAPTWICQLPGCADGPEPLHLLQLLRCVGRRAPDVRADFNGRDDILAADTPSIDRCRHLDRRDPGPRLRTIQRTRLGRTLVPDLDTLLALEDLARALAPGAASPVAALPRPGPGC